MSSSRRTRRHDHKQSFRRHQLRLEGLEKRYALNAAPVLNSAASPQLNSVTEDAGSPVGQVGTLVSDLIDSGGTHNNFSDADGDLPGIAITATNLQGGTLWYSTDNGTTWLDVESVSDGSPRLLAANERTRVFFEPTLNLNGVVDDIITFKAWDQQSSNSLSTTTDTIRIEVVPADPWLQQIPLFADRGWGNHFELLADNTTILAFDCYAENLIDFAPLNNPDLNAGMQAVFVKYNRAGDTEWVRDITTENEDDSTGNEDDLLWIQGLESTPDGGVVIFGSCAEAQFAGYPESVGDENTWGFFVAKLSSDGVFDWVVDVECNQPNSYTGHPASGRNWLTVDDSGNIFILEKLNSSDGTGTLEIDGSEIYSSQSTNDTLLFHFSPTGSLEECDKLI